MLNKASLDIFFLLLFFCFLDKSFYLVFYFARFGWKSGVTACQTYLVSVYGTCQEEVYAHLNPQSLEFWLYVGK